MKPSDLGENVASLHGPGNWQAEFQMVNEIKVIHILSQHVTEWLPDQLDY